jgi:hypothetical protein
VVTSQRLLQNIARADRIIEQNKTEIARLQGLVEQNKIKQSSRNRLAACLDPALVLYDLVAVRRDVCFAYPDEAVRDSDDVAS